MESLFLAEKISANPEQCKPDWVILKVLMTNFLSKIAQIFVNFLGYFKKCNF